MGDDTSSNKPEVVPIFAPQTLIVVASLFLAVVCVAILVFFTRRKSRSTGNLLLLVGPPDGGKTAILSMLVYDQALPTHTSLQVNASSVAVPRKKPLTVVDIPGHPRIRNQVNEHITNSKAIAFVVDASTISRNGPVVAEHLHIILNAITSLPPSQVLPSLLILAHKSDLVKSGTTSSTIEALAINRVKTILERELEKRRASQSGGVGVEELGEEGARTELGGLECSGEKGVFRFDAWEGGEVVFLGTSVKTEKSVEEKDGVDGLASLREWMEDNA